MFGRHDHMFACGFYPNRNAFHDSVTEELNAQVKRLRNHPSIVLWCGDNEFYMMADRQNIPYDVRSHAGAISRFER